MANNVTINVTNQSEDELDIVIFQQDPNINQMFDKIFPVAWKVMPLKPSTPTKRSRGHTIYPIQQGIGVDRESQAYDRFPFSELDVTMDADNGDQLQFTIDTDEALDLNLLATRNTDPSISCLNASDERIAAISLYKNGSVVVTQLNVASDDRAVFLLTPKIYLMWVSNMKEGTLFKSFVEGDHVTEVDLTGVTELNATVVLGGPGGKKAWQIEVQ